MTTVVCILWLSGYCCIGFGFIIDTICTRKHDGRLHSQIVSSKQNGEDAEQARQGGGVGWILAHFADHLAIQNLESAFKKSEFPKPIVGFHWQPITIGKHFRFGSEEG